MKRFLKIIGIVAILLYGLNIGIDYAISYKLQHSVDRRYIGWSKIINEQLDADLVVMGSSRAWVHYNPAIMDSILMLNTYNMGIDGSGLNRQIIRYEIYNHYQIKKPKYIVLNIDYFSASEWTYGYEREQFFPFMWDSYMRKEISKVEPMSWGERYMPVYRYVTYKGLYNVIHERPMHAKTYKGYMGQDRTWNAKAYEELSAYHFNADERIMELFEKFLADREEEGIQVVFCYAPVYIGFTNKIENLDDFFACYESYAKKYNIPILDYTYSELSKDTTYFYNASHMNRHGAELFSMQFATDLYSKVGIK